ncbi:MAG: hypothetical protein ACK4SY_07025 [Pyrobaculum sp.]
MAGPQNAAVALLLVAVIALGQATCFEVTYVSRVNMTTWTTYIITSTETIFNYDTTVIAITNTTTMGGTPYTYAQTKYIVNTTTLYRTHTFSTTMATIVQAPPTTHFSLSCTYVQWTAPQPTPGNPVVGGPWTALDSISKILTPIIVLGVVIYSLHSGRAELAIGMVVGGITLFLMQQALGQNPVANVVMTVMFLAAFLLYMVGRQ